MSGFRKAERKKAKLRLGISAPSGCGKTMGSLLLAYGILKAEHPDFSDEQIWSLVALIDTEEGSGELYVGARKYGITIGQFNYCRISAPFGVKKYTDNLHDAERNGWEVVIEDSISHAWAASGGILDKKDRISEQKGNNSYTAWRFVTPEHNAFIDAMLQSPAHIIATMRSKTEYVQEKGADGKTTIRKVGMAPVQRDGMEYEFTTVFDINFDCFASATKDRTDLFSEVDAAGRLVKKSFLITPDTGRILHEWLNTGVETLDTLCERLAGEIRAANAEGLSMIYHKSGPLLERITAERPEWNPFITELFEARAKELGLTA